MRLPSAVAVAHHLIGQALPKARIVVDATTGNGKDTLFLAEKSPENAIIYAFDIQRQALESTEELLSRHGLNHKVKYILDSHANLREHITQPIDIVMFNLGYLPGGNHSITTQAESTILALKQCAELMSVGGLMTVTAYPGHSEGFRENSFVEEFIGSLQQPNYAAACWKMINQKNQPPLVYVVEKRREIHESFTAF